MLLGLREVVQEVVQGVVHGVQLLGVLEVLQGVVGVLGVLVLRVLLQGVQMLVLFRVAVGVVWEMFLVMMARVHQQQQGRRRIQLVIWIWRMG